MIHRLAIGSIAIVIKFVLTAIFAAFILSAVVTFIMLQSEADLLLLVFILLAGLSIFYHVGLGIVIARYLSPYDSNYFAEEKLNSGLLSIVTLATPIVTLCMAMSEPIAIHVFNKPNSDSVQFGNLLVLHAMALFFFLSFAFQEQFQVVLAALFKNLGVSTLFNVAFSYIWCNELKGTTAVRIAPKYATFSVIIAIADFVIWLGQKEYCFTLKVYNDQEVAEASMSFWSLR